MLVTIKTEEARVGMFVHSVAGGWMASPFWRSQLVLARTSEIRKLRESGIGEIVIDTARGVGPAVAAVNEPTAASVIPVSGAEPDASEPQASTIDRAVTRRRRTPLSAQERALAMVDASKGVVRAMFDEVRLGKAVDVNAMAPLVGQIGEAMTRDPGAMLNVTRLRTKDEYTYIHSIAVAALLINFGQHLALPDADVHELGLAGLLHDIGKMAVPSALLVKPGQLDPPEIALVRHHPEKGHALLRAGSTVSETVLDVCLHHHERVDGRGYPFGLTGEQLSLAARMSAICDVYDAVTSQRPYKRPWAPSDALSRMRQWSGHFDQDLLTSFIDSIGIQPIDGLVRLSSSRLALVMEGNDQHPTEPRVRVFYDIPQHRLLPLQDAIASHDGDPVHRAERGSHWFGERWDGMKAAIRAGTMPRADDETGEPIAAPPRGVLS
ncbi:hypothetical protein ASE95_09715 [Sphingomonas sp. Leaf231]|uniref:HD-GYP domain-containing protein n=1 Tax=Sphingomonas sp. Leaf231 TaxID=1736301 RepID=UPI0006FB366D|nr:HD-GYP domain-containing protein [Sphingomonas sp. Leaf231]KQN92893.1 hypothetical protein ASE95_09715 [Sphingomonas sp. Leaf231]